MITDNGSHAFQGGCNVYMAHHNRLPASFTSLYRLFLRTASAAVLHHRSARLNLITRWRPTFDAAAKVTKELEYSPQSNLPSWRQERIDWLTTWNERGWSCLLCFKASNVYSDSMKLIVHSHFYSHLATPEVCLTNSFETWLIYGVLKGKGFG